MNESQGESTRPRILVAGIGNIFLGDDGFGIEVVNRLAQRSRHGGVRIVDFGIRGVDLALALQESYDAVVLVDAISRGGEPGSVYLLRIGQGDIEGQYSAGSHAIDVKNALRLARSFGDLPENMHLVGCEPAAVGDGVDRAGRLSAPVAAAVDEAVSIIESLIAQTLSQAPCTNFRSP